jgi:KDO2-lipid IV(A) lauroyltransferase
MNDITPIPPLKLSLSDKVLLAFLHFLGRLPLGLLQGFGRAVGHLLARFTSVKTYQVVRCNLELCFPGQSEEWYQKTVRDNLAHTGMLALEFIKTWGMPTDYSANQITRVNNEQLFHEALAGGKGTIGIIPHFGNWEFMNAWVNRHTGPIIMYKPGKHKAVDEMVREARGRLNATMVATDERGIKTILKGLKKNSFCAILPDHVPHDNGGIFSPFFGISTWSGVIVPKLVGRTGCNVIMMCCVRRSDGPGFEISFSLPDPEIYNTDVALSTAAMNRSIETMIRTDPKNYQWTYKRFKKNETLKDPYSRHQL